MKNRKGKIKINSDILADIENTAGFLKVIFSQFIPVFIDRDFNGSYYSGYSELFDIIKPSDIIPEYEVIVTDNHGVFSIKFIRL